MCACVRAYVCRLTVTSFSETRPKNVASRLWLIVSVQHYSLFYSLSFRVSMTDRDLRKER
jgi:hypothetical protein